MASAPLRIGCILAVALLAASTPLPARALAPCFTPQDAAPRSTIEQDALERSKKKQARRCSRPGVQCYYRVSANPAHEIVVSTGFVYRSPDDARCLYPSGGATDVYRADGSFVHSITTL